jgi:hypothetical protein
MPDMVRGNKEGLLDNKQSRRICYNIYFRLRCCNGQAVRGYLVCLEYFVKA